MASALRLSSSVGEDPFAKIKALISDMLTRLEQDAAEDASHKAYCDKELAETRQKKTEKSTEVEHLSTKIDQKASASAKLKEEVATLQQELAQLAKSQSEMDVLRQKEKADYEINSAETQESLEGVKLALKVLRDYYSKTDKAHDAQEDTATGVIAMLETVESDFSKSLAQMTAVEEAAAAEYTAATKNNEVTKTTKNQDVKYKTKEYVGLDKAVSEHKVDREGVQEELDATLEALKKLEDMCIAKPETYAERAARREAEISGLKDALAVLESESAFVQRTAKHLRGGVHAHVA
jgi:chromosome segregation ATPase